MANYPANIWVIDDNEFDSFTCTGGKVVYIAEDIDPRYGTHPAIITAGALLPPIDAVQAELDGNLLDSMMLYEAYLLREEADPYISIILAAALNQIPIGIMFGRDEKNMQFPKMLIDFVYRYYGLVLGLQGKVQPHIVEELMPTTLAKLYMMDIIDYRTFMEKHPPLPINNIVISKMVYEVNPAVSIKDMQHHTEYFEMVKNSIYKNNGRFLVDPLEAI